MSELDEVLREFLAESQENLEQYEQDLVAIGDGSCGQDRLDRIFRTIHTIKGTCGFLGLARLETLSHAGENLLGSLRDGRRGWDDEVLDNLLALADAVRRHLAQIDADGTEANRDDSPLIARLEALGATSSHKSLGSTPNLPPFGEQDAPPQAEVVDQPPTVESPTTAEAITATEKPQGRDQDTNETIDETANLATGYIRVDIHVLDRLINQVGELVLARNQILQHLDDRQDPALTTSCQHLNLITSELREGMMKTRMQAIGTIWNRFPRIVRDLAHQCGKDVELRLEGSETELDRTIVEAIRDPLTHIVRNSIDHGLETPEERRVRNKPERGRLHLRAYHESGQVNIEISDDGRGIDPSKIARKAIDRGLISSDDATRMSDRDLVQLVFVAGLSTKDQVTNLSGRGVGMDVVRTNLERIGGSIDLQNRPGQGVTIRIRIPLTLAIIPALIVVEGDQRFAIPQVNLLELVRLDSQRDRAKLSCVRGAAIYRFRGDTLPIVTLASVLNEDNDSSEVWDRDALDIVILQSDTTAFGLIVQAIHNTEEIVVKPLGRQIKSIPLFSGATIMGDGRVALILDVPGLARSAGTLDMVHEAISLAEQEDQHVDRSSRGEQTYLLFRVGTRRMAAPLSQIARLEEIDPTGLEHAAGFEVVQYRGHILPLVPFDRSVRISADFSAGDPPLQVLVLEVGSSTIGLIASEILDVVTAPAGLENNSGGLGGTTVIDQLITEVIDLNVWVRTNAPALTQEMAEISSCLR